MDADTCQAASKRLPPTAPRPGLAALRVPHHVHNQLRGHDAEADRRDGGKNEVQLTLRFTGETVGVTGDVQRIGVVGYERVHLRRNRCLQKDVGRLVREMVSGETNCSPDDILDGKWVFLNFPPSSWGEVGAFICSGWKYLTELAVLQRKATDNSPFVSIWCDEAHQFVTNFDSSFIAQCRSHKGCLVYRLRRRGRCCGRGGMVSVR